MGCCRKWAGAAQTAAVDRRLTSAIMDHLSKGRDGEKLAEAYLRSQGCKTIAVNVTSKFGEIDIICRDQSELVFVEVRYRSQRNYGTAAETVSMRKQQKVIKTAQYFLQQHPKFNSLYMRFDVIGIDASNNIEWIKGAFQATA